MAIKDLLIRLKLKGAKKAKGDLGGVDRSMKTLAKSAVVAAGSFYALKKAFDFTVELKNFARDAEETTNKFKTVFSSMESAATKTAKTLAASFGMAHTTAMELLGDTGDILVGFGFTEESALELSKKVQELSIDLASFTNYAGGASGASQALTKAILGETESAKSLGIVLRQGTAEFKDSVKALQESEGMTYNQAMATTLLNDAYKQSTKAIGDFARTQDDLANQERILSERFKELKEDLGTALLPTFLDLTSAAIDFAEAFGDYIAIPASEKIDKDRFASERLFNVLEDVNASQKVRTDAIKTINSKYGSYLTNLLTEKSSLKDIQKAQDDINKKMLERIAIEVQREEIADNMREMKSLWKDEANLINEVSKAEKKLSEKQTAATVSQKLATEQMERQGKIAPQVASANLDMVESFVSFAGGAEAAGAGVHAANQSLINAEERLEANRKKQEELTEQTEKLREEQVKLAETFGVAPTEAKGGGGSPEIDVLIMTEEQKASIRAEYNERFLEMTKGSYELQSIELDNAVERFREAGIEEVEIARFTKEAKEQLYLNTAQSFASSVAGNLAIMTKAGMITGKEAKRAAQVQAIVDTYAAANAAFKAMAGIPVIGPGLGAFAAATAIAAGLANVRMIESQSFAQGGDFVTSGPQMIMVGDNPSGKERVQITPSEQSQSFNQGGITLNISAPLVDETVIDTIIPAIEKAQRLNLA
jgi:ribosomal protein S8